MYWKDISSYSQVPFVVKSKGESLVLSPAEDLPRPCSLGPALCPSGPCFQALGMTLLMSTWHCRLAQGPHFIKSVYWLELPWVKAGNTWLWSSASCRHVQIIQHCLVVCSAEQHHAGSVSSETWAQLPAASLIILRLFFCPSSASGLFSGLLSSVLLHFLHATEGGQSQAFFVLRFSVTFLFIPWELVWEGHLVDCWHLSNFFRPCCKVDEFQATANTVWGFQIGNNWGMSKWECK